MPENSQRLVRTQAALLVVDIQEKLLPAIFDKDSLVQQTRILINGAVALQVPIWATEQYRHGLGPTVPTVAGAIPNFAPYEKLTFSAGGAPGLWQALRAAARPQVVLCGIEAHVCVCQTCLELLAQGFSPFVVADAVSSRTAANRQLALDRMRAAGAVIVSTEMVLFEWLERAGTDEFKRVLALVK